MHCIGEMSCRFAVFAGPDPCADCAEAVNELHSAAVQAGIESVWVRSGSGTQFAFEVAAHSAEAACELVTTLFRGPTSPPRIDL